MNTVGESGGASGRDAGTAGGRQAEDGGGLGAWTAAAQAVAGEPEMPSTRTRYSSGVGGESSRNAWLSVAPPPPMPARGEVVTVDVTDAESSSAKGSDGEGDETNLTTLALERLHGALSRLQAACKAEEVAVPPVQFARVFGTRVELVLTEPAEPVGEWLAAAECVWQATAPDIDLTDPDSDDAPYPALVPIGRDAEGGLLLVDLLQLHGIHLQGQPELVRTTVHSMAVDLTTMPWAGACQVLFAGEAWRPYCEAISVPFVRHYKDAREAISMLQTAALRAELDGWDDGGVKRRRILFIEPRHEAEVQQLWAVQDDLAGLALVTTGPAGGVGDWLLHLTGDWPGAALKPLGLPLEPQVMADDVFGDLMDALQGISVAEAVQAEADRVSAAAEAELQSWQVASAELRSEPDEDAPNGRPVLLVAPDPEVDLSDVTSYEGPREWDDVRIPADSVPEVTKPLVRLLGPVLVENTPAITDRTARSGMLAVLTYLALQGEPVTAAHIAQNVWATGTGPHWSAETATRYVEQTQEWLGLDAFETDYVQAVEMRESGEADSVTGYQLVGVMRDWDLFVECVGENPLITPTPKLWAGLHVVRGAPMEGTEFETDWGADAAREMRTAVADVAYEVARRCLVAGELRLARIAIRKGRMIDRYDQQLIRLSLTTMSRSDDQQGLALLRDEVTELFIDSRDRMQPQTQAMLDVIPR